MHHESQNQQTPALHVHSIVAVFVRIAMLALPQSNVCNRAYCTCLRKGTSSVLGDSQSDNARFQGRKMGIPCRLAALPGLLLLLLLLGDAAATGSKIWLGYRCYLPGCNQCESGNPYKCLECNTRGGYVKLPDSTCGAWAGAVAQAGGWQEPLVPAGVAAAGGSGGLNIGITSSA